ncbi:MAG TPA: pyridoxal phosphate-dependent aminotransferase [Deltaproteobacteria bacterium]|nr:pyridoxal phosphate-dependent aminotransferase [Deltaproteobacteria bacterium]HPR55754.1 pyridoxal phosphate-dependent aminotransferase [Deltaproteobacteria bacterium]HXK47530.1 pyridoxal phosphate-dependent aminotransferase [Deltaproteobacteria bacterium]
MPVAAKMLAFMDKSSWIRKMFEEGARLKAIHGADRVQDFSLGNPDVPPPERVIDRMTALAGHMFHGYMPNAGYPDVRSAMAAHLAPIYEVPLTGDEIIMSCGAGGAMNVVLKALLNPGDEVMALAPYFVEYGFYADNHGGSLVVANCDKDFLPDMKAVREKLSARTKAIIVNSPNNPTGRVYPEGVLKDLGMLLKEYPDVVVISDEPYRAIVYDGRSVPSVLRHIPNSVVVTSASKELSLAGERIGYIVVNPGIDRKDELIGAMILATRILGFVNAPALMQKVLAECLNDRVDVEIYRARRDVMCAVFDEAGLTYAPAEGAFYLFVKSPLSDEVAFCNLLVEERVLAVPGRGFGWPGWVRFTYCVDESIIKAAGPGIRKAVEKSGA